MAGYPRVQNLGGLGAGSALVTSMNASGQVVGYAVPPGYPFNTPDHAFLWTQGATDGVAGKSADERPGHAWNL